MEIKSAKQLTAIYLMNLSQDEKLNQLTLEQCRMVAEAMVGAYETGYEAGTGKLPFND